VSARGWRRVVSLLGVLAAALAPAVWAQDSVLVRVGGDLAARQGEYLDVPVTVDLSGAPGRLLGGYTAVLRFDAANLVFQQIMSSGFAVPQVNTDSASYGVMRLGALLPSGAGGIVQLFTARFYVAQDTMTNATFTLSIGSMTAAQGSSTPFEDLTPLVRVVNGTFCRSLGKWGDVDGDGVSGSRDALVALSYVVGLPTGEGMQPELADVDADGRVTSRDALVMLSYAVGLPIPGYRVLLTAAGACATGAGRSLAIAPDTLVLVSGQLAAVSVVALDSVGRPVPPTGLIWRSSDGGVANAMTNWYYYYGYGLADTIEARGPGTAILTAEIGPGVLDSLVVVVVPRRPNWVVDVRRARGAVTQTGTARFPFEFIGDAATYAQDGDTVRVSGGVYEETISAQRSLVVIGDSLDRPILDPRGADYWDGYSPALSLGTGAGDVTLLHLVFRRGGAAIYGHNNTARDLRFEDIQTSSALQVESSPNPENPGTPPTSFGNVRISRVFAQHAYDGIVVTQADTAEIWNDTLVGPAQYTGCGEGFVTGIRIGEVVYQTSPEAASVRVHDNRLGPEGCVAISVFTPGAVALIQRNRIDPGGYYGILGSTRDMTLSHNVVHMVSQSTTYGVYISSNTPVDTVRSTGDSLIGAQGYAHGFYADTVGASRIDSLTTDSVGSAADGEGQAVVLNGGRHWLSNSRLRNSGANGITLYAGPGSSLRSRHNRIERTGSTALYVLPGGYYGGGPDSVESIGDTILGASGGGLILTNATAVRVDSALVDSVGTYGYAVTIGARRASLTNSTLSRSYAGVQASADTLLIARNVVTGDTTGIFLQAPETAAWDTAFVYGNVVSGSQLNALEISGRAARADSNVFSGNLNYGVYAYGGGSARMTRSRVQGNGGGLLLGYDGAALAVTGSAVMGNTSFGIRNDEAVTGAVVVDARNNYWGDPAGPRCNVLVTGVDCSASATGDSVTSARVDFSGFLGAPPVTPAPPAFGRLSSLVALASSPEARTVTMRPARPTPRPAARLAPRPPVPSAAIREATSPRFPPMYRKGSPPRPAAPALRHPS